MNQYKPVKKVTLLDLKDLRSVVEEYFKDKKEEIAALNQYCSGDKTFLYRTYCVEWPFERGNPNIKITVFRDLPSPYPEKISQQIRIYMMAKKIDAEFRFWTSYQSLKDLDPVRPLRN